MTFQSVLIFFGILITAAVLGKDFNLGFWQNLLSNLAAVIAFGIFIGQFSDLFKKPDPTLVIKQDYLYSKHITFSLSEDYYVATFELVIKNSGDKALKAGEGYWHFYLPADTRFEISDMTLITGTARNHVRDLIKLPAYPKSFLELGAVMTLKIKKENIKNVKFHYFFQTDYGLFPSTAVLDQDNGGVLFKNMYEIPFQIE